MAFIDKTLSNKQRLNLSPFANGVIENDMFTFGWENRSGFVNMIFEHFYPQANASVARSIQMLQGQLNELFSPVPADDKAKTLISNVLTNRRTDELRNKAYSYEKGVGFYIWLNEKNYGYLSEPDSECGENDHYKRRGDYIKSVLEEYARLPYVERELVAFAPLFSEINLALEKKCQLRLKTSGGGLYSVYPYGIRRDPLSTANYLVGYSTLYDSPTDDKRPCSFRISAMRSLRAEKSKSAFLKKGNWTLLEKEIASRGVQFLSSNEINVVVRLTAEGLRNYRRQVHMRPMFIQRDGDIFSFSCTPAQARFYSLKFGKEAEIISPPDLREEFASAYRAAADLYPAQQTHTK